MFQRRGMKGAGVYRSMGTKLLTYTTQTTVDTNLLYISNWLQEGISKVLTTKI